MGRWPPLPSAALWRGPTSFPTARSSPSVTRGSGAPRPSSSLPSSEWSPAVSMRLLTTPSWSATSTSVRTCTLTPCCPEVPPCTPASPTECRRRSPPWPQHNEDQDHRSPREEVLCVDRRLHPGLPVHLPADVDPKQEYDESGPSIVHRKCF